MVPSAISQRQPTEPCWATWNSAERGISRSILKTRRRCSAFPFRENQSGLENDPVFLRFVLGQLAGKLSLSAIMTVSAQTLEEKVLFFLRKVQANHEISSVNHALQPLHCSRRQLQRVLKKLCDDGLLIKTGRGCYRLKEYSEDSQSATCSRSPLASR